MTASADDAFATYRALLAKVDDKFAAIHAQYPQSFACGRGCHACCQAALTVNRVERDHIAAYLQEHPAQARAVAINAGADPWQGRRCQFLDASGACGIYEARPVVCRSHGAPLLVKEQEQLRRDVCPLNFTQEISLEDVSPEALINLETLTTLLVMINIRYQGTADDTRFALRPSLNAIT